jgi:tetratricopeptide (TPR) repeat protein
MTKKRKLKIGVYGLCKNEVSYIDPWFESCKEADVIAITDTGSTDGSLEQFSKLIDKNDHVLLHYLRVMPWRFDDAFNAAMNHLPDDVDVCIRLDFDERLQPGWRKALEAAWTPQTTRLRYPYVWNWNPDGTPDRQWMGDRIHARKNYRWSGATHEGLSCRGPEVQTWVQTLRIHQFPLNKPRPNDLPLLEEAVRETPNDTRLWGYLGREYFFKGNLTKCVETYMHFLTMPSATQERVQAYLYLAKCEDDRAPYYLRRGAAEGPEYREPWVDLAMHHHRKEQWRECYDATTEALKRTRRPDSYICTTEAWGARTHDLRSIAAFRLGLVEEAVEQAKLAIAKDPADGRLKSNLELFEAALHG